MAEIDVTELFSDPDFMETFVVTRSQQSIDDNGRATNSSIGGQQTITGVVQPAGGRTMNMVPNMTSVQGSIEIWTSYRLEVPSDTTQSDIVTWNGRDYIVQVVQDWSNYGTGFVHAVATMRQFLAASPTNTVTTKDV